MKKSEIKVGGHYNARVSGKHVIVRVDRINELHSSAQTDRKARTSYSCTNLATSRQVRFESAAKFRSEAKMEPKWVEEKNDGTVYDQSDEMVPVVNRVQVEIHGTAYTYETDLELAVGDIVEVPFGKQVKQKPVICIGSGYVGECKRVIQLVQAATPPSEEFKHFCKPTAEASAEADPTCQMKTSTIQSDASALGTLDVQSVVPSIPAPIEDEQRSDPPASASTQVAPVTAVAKPAPHPASAQAVKPLNGLAAKLGAIGNVLPTAESGHTEVPALAGTGKTTTIVEGLKEAKGVRSDKIPSDEQAAVWKDIANHRHGTVRLSAFNTKITNELKSRVDQFGLGQKGVEAKGIHSLGNYAVTKRFGRLSPERANWVVKDIVAKLLGRDDAYDFTGKPEMDMIVAVDSLVSLCKQTMTEPTIEGIEQLASHYDVEMNGNRDRIMELTPQALEKCKTPGKDITFDDMVWLPLVHDLPIFKVDLQIIDESQDLNRMQQLLMLRAGHRILFVGDKYQAIMGFAGADDKSMERLKGELNASSLPLTVTRRCGKAIVKEAQKHVPWYTAHDSNCEGLVDRASIEEGAKCYRTKVQPKDFVLCRCNAPLVSQCFRFLKAGVKANILGREVGKGLLALLKKSKASKTPDLISYLDSWLAKEMANENAKRMPSEARLENLQDRHDCILAFCEGQSEVAAVEAKINEVFADTPSNFGITLSSIHKSKGLEAERVFLLQPPNVGPRMDKMQPWEIQQERNLVYVAQTRAIRELWYVR